MIFVERFDHRENAFQMSQMGQIVALWTQIEKLTFWQHQIENYSKKDKQTNYKCFATYTKKPHTEQKRQMI